MNPLIFWIDEIHGDATQEVVIDGKAEREIFFGSQQERGAHPPKVIFFIKKNEGVHG
jgi:hypothetical protein